MRALLCLGLFAALAGCQQVATFAGADALNAGSMASRAAANGDVGAAGRGVCYKAFGNVANGVASAPANTTGVFTAVESGIEIQSTIQRPECQAISAQVLMWMARKAPGGNLLPF